MRLHRDLREFIELLNSHGVEYLVMGGHAVAYHGYPRFTGDIDFLIRPTQENARRVVAVLKGFGFTETSKLEAALTASEQVIQLGRPPNRIDVLTSATGIDFDPAWADSVEASLDGLPVRFPNLESLLANKRATGRPKDVADVYELEKLSRRGERG